ncbi:MAG: dihydrofolate reductase [Clostridium sp.]|jgi:dihydrofolate reductase/glyoxylase-like metal-dependent hydrolase (beta-lactamase superfamily II)
MRIIDVSGIGTGAVFLLRGKANLLFEAGMAYAADAMVEAIERELGDDGSLDGVLLSHSHYDHVAGLPALRKRWPELKTYASVRAQEILVKPGALATIRRLSGEAAAAAELPWDRDYRDEDLKIDVALEDGERVRIGDHQVFAFATIGHTKCSMSYVVDGEVMLCSETVGVMGKEGGYMPSFLVDYRGAEESIRRSSEIPVSEIILNHYGLVSPENRAGIWVRLMEELRDSRDRMVEIMNAFPEDEKALREMERVFHGNVDKKLQPDEAFYINAASMMRTLRRQFPEEFSEEERQEGKAMQSRSFQLIAAVDRNWAIGRKGQMLVAIPADQKLFRQETMGKIVVMGRKTFLTLPGQRPLDGRHNVILTENDSWNVKGAHVCRSEKEALDVIGRLEERFGLSDADVYIIGGESIYRQFLPYCSTAHITWIDYSYEADTHMVNLESAGWKQTETSEEQTFFDLCYEFRKYSRQP